MLAYDLERVESLVMRLDDVENRLWRKIIYKMAYIAVYEHGVLTTWSLEVVEDAIKDGAMEKFVI